MRNECVRESLTQNARTVTISMCGLASAKFKELTFQMVSRTHKHHIPLTFYQYIYTYESFSSYLATSNEDETLLPIFSH